jgi:hypothetical protein
VSNLKNKFSQIFWDVSILAGVSAKPDPSVVSVETQSPVFTRVWTSLPMRKALGFDVLTFPCNDVGGMLLTFLEQRPRYLPLPSM